MIPALNRKPLMLMQILSARYFRYEKITKQQRTIVTILQGLTLDIDRGNLLRLGKDGVILAASHGTRKMSDIEIEKAYGRGRKKHIASDYAIHLHVSIYVAQHHEITSNATI